MWLIQVFSLFEHWLDVITIKWILIKIYSFSYTQLCPSCVLLIKTVMFWTQRKKGDREGESDRWGIWKAFIGRRLLEGGRWIEGDEYLSPARTDSCVIVGWKDFNKAAIKTRVSLHPYYLRKWGKRGYLPLPVFRKFSWRPTFHGVQHYGKRSENVMTIADHVEFYWIFKMSLSGVMYRRKGRLTALAFWTEYRH